MTAPNDLSAAPVQGAFMAANADPERSSNISGRDVAFIFGGITLLGLLATAAGVALAITNVLDEDDILSPWCIVIYCLFIEGSMLGMAWLRMRGRWRRASDWHLAPFKPIYVVVGLALGAAIAGVYDLLPLPRSERIIGSYLRDPSAGALVLGAITAFLGPFVEEVMFRGILCRWLSERFNAIVGIVVSSLAFGGVHYEGSWTFVAVATGIGVVFASAYQIQKSLLSVILAHVLINSGAVMSALEKWP